TAPMWRPMQEGLFKLESSEGYQESFLSLPSTFQRLPFQEGIATVPNRGVLLAAPLETFEALADATRQSLEQMRPGHSLVRCLNSPRIAFKPLPRQRLKPSRGP